MASNDLVTLQEVKGRLHIDYNDDDVNLSQLIGAVSASILRYLKSDGDEYRDSSGDIVAGNVEDDIKAAAMWMIAAWYDDADPKVFEPELLPAAVRSLLHSRRDPTLA